MNSSWDLVYFAVSGHQLPQHTKLSVLPLIILSVCCALLFLSSSLRSKPYRRMTKRKEEGRGVAAAKGVLQLSLLAAPLVDRCAHPVTHNCTTRDTCDVLKVEYSGRYSADTKVVFREQSSSSFHQDQQWSTPTSSTKFPASRGKGASV